MIEHPRQACVDIRPEAVALRGDSGKFHVSVLQPDDAVAKPVMLGGGGATGMTVAVEVEPRSVPADPADAARRVADHELEIPDIARHHRARADQGVAADA